MRSIRCVYTPWARCQGMSPRQRAGRRRTTEKAKQEINRRQRKWRLMQLINANFVSGRDLFVCLTYAPEASKARALEKFHAKMKKAYARLGLVYKYIAVTEEHDMDGEPVRLHHHLILSGAHGVQLAEVCASAGLPVWPMCARCARGRIFLRIPPSIYSRRTATRARAPAGTPPAAISRRPPSRYGSDWRGGGGRSAARRENHRACAECERVRPV